MHPRLLTATLCMLFLPAMAAAQSVSLDHVDGVYNDTTLLAGGEAVFYLRLTNPSIYALNINNGYEVYSPDGATWTPAVGDSLNVPAGAFAQYFINCFSCDGSGADSLQFSGIAIGAGLPPGYDNVMNKITITSFAADHGKHICLDSAFTYPGGSWKWSAPGGIEYTPAWDGPHCFKLDACADDPTDADGDGTADACDNCPDDPNADQANGDADEFGDACDNCPEIDNPTQADGDSDEVGDDCDNCPTDANTNQANSDTDAIGDACDNCPTIDNPSQADLDADNVGDDCDNCPDDPNTNQTDSDGDLIGDACDNCPDDQNVDQADSDADNIGDVCDNCPTDANADQADSDGDGIGDACDPCTDTDGDFYGDPGFPANTCPEDNCPDDSNNSQVDSDADGLGDACDNCADLSNPDQTDSDSDNVGNDCDNCPTDANTNQADVDADAIGDVCDNCPDDQNVDQADADSDDVGDLCDNCPIDPNATQTDSDSDSYGNACDNCPTDPNVDQTDTDSDNLGDVCDNCPDVPNPSQGDADNDGLGDDCDECTDTDNDGFGNPGYAANTCPDDNCPNTYNPTQSDVDGDGLGAACDNCPDVNNPSQTDGDSDGVGTDCDNCPDTNNPDQSDSDGDNIGDVCDGCCQGMSGNVDDDPEGVVDINDLTFLIGHLFVDFREIPCFEAANTDGADDINISDLVRLIDYLFINFWPPESCTEASQSLIQLSPMNLQEPGRLPTGQLIYMYLRVVVESESNVLGFTNGFHIYSPNGAAWTETLATDRLRSDWDTRWDLGHQAQVESGDGHEADSVLFWGVVLAGVGMEPGFDEQAFRITIGPIPKTSHGRTICLDSAFVSPGGEWRWAHGGGVNTFPVWNGPYCWLVDSVLGNPPQGEPDTVAVPGEYPTIQSALNSASNGWRIEVAPGTYTISSPLNFRGLAVSLIGTGGASVTTIAAANDGIDIAVFDDMENANSVLEGFTLQGGHIAIYCKNSGPTIRHCVMRDQTITNWAAVVLAGTNYGQNGPSPAQIINCTIVNSANGGISSFSTVAPTIRNTIIADCHAYAIHRDGTMPLPELGYNNVWNCPQGYLNMGGVTGIGSLFVAPLFDANYGLTAGSLCIDAGDPSFGYNDPDGTRNDIGAIYFPQ